MPDPTPKTRASLGGGRDDRAFPRVAATAHDQGHAGQLRTTQHLDRRDELVEINMQHPGAKPAVHLTSTWRRFCAVRYTVFAGSGVRVDAVAVAGVPAPPSSDLDYLRLP